MIDDQALQFAPEVVGYTRASLGTMAMQSRDRRWRFAVAAAILLASCSPPSKQAAVAVSSAQPSSARPTAPEAVKPQPQVILAKGEVALVVTGGTFELPVRMNEAITLDFTLDSGASDVSIPADVVMTLVRTGTITQADFIGTKTFMLADGSQVPSTEFRLRSVKIGDIVIPDVVASVADARATPLLGQTFLSRLASWSIDNERHVLRVNLPAAESPAPVTVATQETLAANAGASPPASAALVENGGALAGNGGLTSEQMAAARTAELIRVWSDPQNSAGDAVRRFYAANVNYYGGMTTVDAVMLDKTRFASRWPARSYVIRPASVSVVCSVSNLCSVQGVLDWRAANSATGASSAGTAQFDYRFRDGLIEAETSKVLSRQ